MSALSRLTAALAVLLALAASSASARADDDVAPQPPTAATASAQPAPKADVDRVARWMARLDRGKKHLDRAAKLDVPALKDGALEKAALTFERTLDDVAAEESELSIVLADETRALLVTALNARARLELDRGRPERARPLNDRARELAEDDRATKELGAAIAAALAPEPVDAAPPPQAAAAQDDDAAREAAERRAYEDGYDDGVRDGRRVTTGLFDLTSTRRACDRRTRDRTTSDRHAERRREDRRSRYGSRYGVRIDRDRSGFRVRTLHDPVIGQGTPRGRSYTTPNFAPTVGGGSRGFGPLIVDPRPY